MKRRISILLAVTLLVSLGTLSYANEPVIGPIGASTPVIVYQPADIAGPIGSEAILYVSAAVPDGGQLSYQWYSNLAFSNIGGDAIEGATGNAFSAPTDAAGIVYYYAVVTNTRSRAAAPVSVASDAVFVNVEAPGASLSALDAEPTLPLVAHINGKWSRWFTGPGDDDWDGDYYSYEKDGALETVTGGRLAIMAEYYLSAAVPSGASYKFQWFKGNSPDGPWDKISAMDLGQGNTFMPDTAVPPGTTYYYAEMTYTPNGGTPVVTKSDVAAVKVNAKVATSNPLSTSLTAAEASGWRLTTSSAEVVAYCKLLAANSGGRIRMEQMVYRTG